MCTSNFKEEEKGS